MGAAMGKGGEWLCQVTYGPLCRVTYGPLCRVTYGPLCRETRLSLFFPILLHPSVQARPAGTFLRHLPAPPPLPSPHGLHLVHGAPTPMNPCVPPLADATGGDPPASVLQFSPNLGAALLAQPDCVASVWPAFGSAARATKPSRFRLVVSATTSEARLVFGPSEGARSSLRSWTPRSLAPPCTLGSESRPFWPTARPCSGLRGTGHMSSASSFTRTSAWSLPQPPGSPVLFPSYHSPWTLSPGRSLPYPTPPPCALSSTHSGSVPPGTPPSTSLAASQTGFCPRTARSLFSPPSATRPAPPTGPSPWPTRTLPTP